MKLLTATIVSVTMMGAFLPFSAVAQTESYDKPYYLPGEGMYLVGLPSNLSPVVSEPTLVTQAYQSKVKIFNTEFASIKAGENSYNLADRIREEGILDLVSFMGVGNAYDLTVRDMSKNLYRLGDNAPQKDWYNTRILAASPNWRGHHTLPLAMYDQWDCPITFAPEKCMAAKAYDAVTVDFGNPHEGLVLTGVNFPVVSAPDNDIYNRGLRVKLNVWDESHTKIIHSVEDFITFSSLKQVGNDGDNIIYSLSTDFHEGNIVISTPFDITVSGFAAEGVHAWLPIAVDHVGIYPTHTTYSAGLAANEDGESPDLSQDNSKFFRDNSTDVVINAEGYFNYIGTWGWWDGKMERGEVVGSADLVQVYYDPSDPDWPGDYFLGEAAFPLESTFGSEDITIAECPEWINAISYDDSQWDEYGCVQITMSADELPPDVQGRNGKVVLCTTERASFYTIYIRQGMAWFDMDGIQAPYVGENSDAALYDLNGRRIKSPRKGQPYVRGGKTCIEF